LLKPFFTYFGGKYRIAPKYQSPLYDTIVEPFAGSAGYSLRYHNKNVILNDLDEKIFGIWDFLIKSKSEDIMNLPLDISGGIDNLPQNICQEAKWLIGFWLYKGSSSPGKTPSSWMRQGTHTTSFWGSVIRERIASQVVEIRHWKIFNKSYSDIPISNERHTWFVDPPYQNAGKHYRKSSSGIDFKNLGDWCKSRQGQIIVCENSGADWLPFEPFLDIKAMHGGKRTGISQEVIFYKEEFSEKNGLQKFLSDF
jgi:site-specific DNA-adenine methylase